MRSLRLVALALAIGLLAVAGVLAFDPPRSQAALVDTTLPRPLPLRLNVSCSSPWERWTGHDYDGPTGLTTMTPRTYETGLLSVEAGESNCLLESGDHEEMLTILALTGLVLLGAAANVRGRRPGADRQRRSTHRSAKAKGTAATITSAT